MRTKLTVALAILMLAVACSSQTDSRPDMSGMPGSGDVGDTEPTNEPATEPTIDQDPDGSGNQDPDDVVDLDPDDVVLTAGLARFDDCDTLLDYLRVEYSARVGPFGFGDGRRGWEGTPETTMDMDDDMAEADEQAAEPASSDTVGAMSDDSSQAQSALVEGEDYSGTNIQEAGVDEADIIKTDGRRIFTLSTGRLVVTDVADRSAVGAVTIAEGWGREMFIHGDDLLLITRYSSEGGDGAETVIQRLTTEDNTPEIIQTIRVQGSYVSARSVNGTARVVLQYDPSWNFPFVSPQTEAAYDQAEMVNREAVLNSSLDDWLPHYTTGAADSSTGTLLTPCPNVHAPSTFSGFGITTVISLPIGDDFDPALTTGVLASGDTVYASTESLYVTTTRWLFSGDFDDDDDWEQALRERRTSIHRFDITGTIASYEASGEVLGVMHNQFSLSEHSGHLRVVTTVSGPAGDESESHVRVLNIAADPLVEVGSVGNIGRGEQVQSVRFVGDIGYVVTFRQIDPFYTIDLSDPTNPRILGELKIPGFSSYLHPISSSLVLGVGSDADPEGRVTGSKVSLFDVSDLAAPREVAVWTAPDGWNDVGWEHKAFLWWAPESLAVVPVTVWNEWTGAVVLRVADGTITEIGRVDHEVEGKEPGQTPCRKITEADIESAMESVQSSGTSNSTLDDLEWIVSDGIAEAIACESGEAGMTGFECYVDTHFDEGVRESDLLSDDETLWTCWHVDRPDVIVRSIVIGEELWTLSLKDGNTWNGADEESARLHVNDLATLERLAALEL